MVYRGKQRTMPEILIELREDDPEFKQAISAQGFRAGQTIAEPEALNLNLYTLMKGRVQLIREGPNGRRLAIAALGPGAMFGEGALLRAEDPTVKAVALTDCIIWAVGAPQAQELVMRYPVLSWGMLQTVGERLVQVENRMEEVAYKRFPSAWPGSCWSFQMADGPSVAPAIRLWRTCWAHIARPSARSCGASRMRDWLSWAIARSSCVMCVVCRRLRAVSNDVGLG